LYDFHTYFVIFPCPHRCIPYPHPHRPERLLRYQSEQQHTALPSLAPSLMHAAMEITHHEQEEQQQAEPYSMSINAHGHAHAHSHAAFEAKGAKAGEGVHTHTHSSYGAKPYQHGAHTAMPKPVDRYGKRESRVYQERDTRRAKKRAQSIGHNLGA